MSCVLDVDPGTWSGRDGAFSTMVEQLILFLNACAPHAPPACVARTHSPAAGSGRQICETGSP